VTYCLTVLSFFSAVIYSLHTLAMLSHKKISCGNERTDRIGSPVAHVYYPSCHQLIIRWGMDIHDNNITSATSLYFILSRDSDYTTGSGWKQILFDTDYSYPQVILMFTSIHRVPLSLRSILLGSSVLCHRRLRC
jgi:hypothetical protein